MKTSDITVHVGPLSDSVKSLLEKRYGPLDPEQEKGKYRFRLPYVELKFLELNHIRWWSGPQGEYVRPARPTRATVQNDTLFKSDFETGMAGWTLSVVSDGRPFPATWGISTFSVYQGAFSAWQNGSNAFPPGYQKGTTAEMATSPD